MFNPDEFGAEVGKFITETIAPLSKKIADFGSEIEALRAENAELKSLVSGLELQHGVDGKDGKDGKDLSFDDIKDNVLELISSAKAEIAEYVKAIPLPKDGVDGKDGANGKDGVDGKSVSMEEIELRLDAAVSKWALEFERRGTDLIQRAIDKIPTPKDGRDGIDGLGFDDLSAEFDGEKTVTLKFAKGEQVKEFKFALPVTVDKGVYKEGVQYLAGDGVTWCGSYWIAKRNTNAKPDSSDSGWRLAVRKGRDGRNGRDGIDKTAAVKL